MKTNLLCAATAAAILAASTSAATARPKSQRIVAPIQPAIPAGFSIGARTLDRQDVPEFYILSHVPGYLYPGASERNAANVSARIQGQQGMAGRSIAPLWADSDQSGTVVVSLGDGYLPLDHIAADDDVVSVRVRDEFGNVVTLAQRAYKANGQTEALDASVRVDDEGRLLALPVARLTQAEDGSVRVIRDGNLSEAVTVEYRLVRAGTSPHVLTPTQFVTIQAGETTSQPLPIQAKAGDVLTLKAGNGYTAAPLENSDVIQFATN